jgi:hypothetical protein
VYLEDYVSTFLSRCLNAKTEAGLESLRKTETFEYKLDIFQKLNLEFPSWHNSQNLPLICTVCMASGCMQIQNHIDLHAKPPRSMCKSTSVTLHNHLGLCASLFLHQNSSSGSMPIAHLNNEKNQKRGVWP